MYEFPSKNKKILRSFFQKNLRIFVASGIGTINTYNLLNINNLKNACIESKGPISSIRRGKSCRARHL